MTHIINIGIRIFIVLCLFSCSNNEYQETNGRIVERKDIGNGQIQINYIFKIGQTTVAGRKKLDNKSIPEDSIRIKYNTKNPLENELIFLEK